MRAGIELGQSLLDAKDRCSAAQRARKVPEVLKRTPRRCRISVRSERTANGSPSSLEPAVVSSIRDKSKRSLERAIVRFEGSIAEPIEAEQRAIDSERDELSALEQLKEELAQQDRELERRVRAAADASVGLCR